MISKAIRKIDEKIKEKDYLSLFEIFSQLEGAAVSYVDKGTQSERDLIHVIITLINSNKLLLKELMNINNTTK